MSEETTKREFNFLAWLTGLVVLLYVGASIYTLAKNMTTWQEFSGAVGPIAGLLIGYWVRGEK